MPACSCSRIGKILRLDTVTNMPKVLSVLPMAFPWEENVLALPLTESDQCGRIFGMNRDRNPCSDSDADGRQSSGSAVRYGV